MNAGEAAAHAAQWAGFDALDVSELRRRRSAKWTRFEPDVLPAHVAEMDFSPASAVVDVVRAAVDRGDFGYAPRSEDVGFDLAVAQWMKRDWSWTVDPAMVTLIADVVRGLEIGVRAFSEPGDGVVVTTPVYYPFRTVTEFLGRRLADVALVRDGSSWRLDIDGIDAAMASGSRVVMLCHPHNPTGTLWRDDELHALVEVVTRHEGWIVSDEIHAPLTYDRGAFGPLAARSPAAAAAECTLTITSTSKSWNLAGLKAAAAISASPRVHERVMALHPRTRSGAGNLGVEAMMAAMSHGRSWLDGTVAYLDGNRRWLSSAIAEGLPGVRYQMPDASYLAWLDFGALGLGRPAVEFFLEHARVSLTGGGEFGAEFDSFARLNFGTSRAILADIVERMGDAVRRFAPL